MKNLKGRLTVAGAMLAMATLSSCGYNISNNLNTNANTTQVQLQSNNFRVVDRVSGSDKVTYIFGIGGMGASDLHQNAYANMMEKADLKNGSRAIANVTYEEHVGGVFPIFFTETVNVSANVIEFTK